MMPNVQLNILILNNISGLETSSYLDMSEKSIKLNTSSLRCVFDKKATIHYSFMNTCLHDSQM